MKSMQRKFGGMMKRSADEADIGAVLNEFKAMDDMLDRLIRDTKAYRNAWEDILKLQYDCSEAFADLYKPIEGIEKPGDVRTREPTVTPQRYMQKCLGLQKLYSDLRSDLAQEVGMIERKLLFPAEEAKKAVKPLQKTLKHRDNMKLDYERYLSRADHARKKETRTTKEEVALQTHEANLAQAKIDYETADDQVRQTFPPVTEAVMQLLPYLLHNQIMLQTTIVGQLYTVLDTYTRKHQMPNPAPGDAEIVDAWEREFTGFRKELEQSISTIAQGKAVHAPMEYKDKEAGTVTGYGIRNKAMGAMHRKGSNQPLPGQAGAGAPPGRLAIEGRQGSGSYAGSNAGYDEEEEAAPPKPPRPGGSGGMAISPMPSPSIPMGSKPSMPSPQPQAPYPTDNKSTALTPSWPNHPPPSYEAAYGSNGHTPPGRFQLPALNGSPSPALLTAAKSAYSPDPSTAGSNFRRPSNSSLASAAMAASKKKPPPPIPAKRFPSGGPPVQYVTALYDFEGQNEGDLAFREGDKIKVIKKTESTDDWWDGELAGRRGAFPANYVVL